MSTIDSTQTDLVFHSDNKHIWLLWLQGWENAPWLQRQVEQSWRLHNPGWMVHLVSLSTVAEYVQDIPYIYDKTKTIPHAAMSDIIRLSLLKNHGGVWADSTMLCMQPLDNWVHTAIVASGFWMYAGHGGGLPPNEGPASWFIVSFRNRELIRKWKTACDKYWSVRTAPHRYNWMDDLFRELYQNDPSFQYAWNIIPRIYCELDGQSHTLAKHGMFQDTPHIKHLLSHTPPYALKLWKDWTVRVGDPADHGAHVQKMNAYYAIQLALAKKF